MTIEDFDNAEEYCEEVDQWTQKLESIMREDPCAPTSLLTFLLCDSQQGMFCPLGCEEYEEIGKAMRSNCALFNAAEKSGLLASAIPDYTNAALDNYGSWHCLSDGINEILNSEVLCKYVPFRERTLASLLRSKCAALNLDDADWAYFYQKFSSLFGEERKGY